MTWVSELTGQLDFYVTTGLLPRLSGLSDDEYLWRPVGDSWSIVLGDGGWRAEGGQPAPPTPPLTTIAWRLNHVTREVLGTRAPSLFGGSPIGDDDGADMYDDRHFPEPVPPGAAGAVALFELAYNEWQAGVRGLDDDALLEPLGPRGGPYADDSYAALVLHINREVMAHGAEICLLRDLYRAQRNDCDPVVAAALGGDASAVRALHDGGPHPGLAADAAGRGHWSVVQALVEGGASSEGALHYAAAANQCDLCDVLLTLGADRQALDDLYGQTPAGWADFMGHRELAQRLRGEPSQ